MGSEALWELVKVFLAALLASTLTHLLTHRRFIQGRWWDRKADAYASIIGSLVSMESSLKRMMRAGALFEGDLGFEKNLLGIVDEYNQAWDRLECALAEGDYIVSKRVSDALAELVGEVGVLEFNHPDEVVGMFRGVIDAVRSCLKLVRAEARSDLRVKWYSW